MTVDARDEWKEEMRSAWLYGVLAKAEQDPVKKRLFEELGRAANQQAELWARRLGGDGTLPDGGRFEVDPRARLVAFFVRRLGIRAMRPALAALKVRGLSVYSSQAPHPAGHPMPTSLSDVGSRHRTAGASGSLRAAVFGVSDGLVSNTSLILGVAGATAEPGAILLSGCAGLLAGAFSMGAGEYVSVRSQRELLEHQIALERAELAEYPEEEAEELALIYEARGLPLERAREFARELLGDEDSALDTLAREELGLDPAELGSPWSAALASFLAFAGGAGLPLLPFLWQSGRPAVLTAGVLAAFGLFGVGAAISLFTGRRALWSGLRMVAIGGAAGAVTWLVGSLLGVAVG